ncbi:MAG: HAMP domain-containing histidine kinase [Chloroflexaceae bacterium]|nr:HAMP domain-containing histidine kinase [Chloroflexaceae bacterium]
MFQATRRRLALWYTAVTAVLLVAFATGTYVYVRSTLIERIDDTLKHVVEVIDRSLAIEAVPEGDSPFRVDIEGSFRNPAATVEDDRIDLEWFAPTGELLWSTFAEAPDIPLSLNREGVTVRTSPDYLLRQITKRVEIGRCVLGYLRVSHPWFEVTKPIHRLAIDLTEGTLLMLASVAAIGWLLSGIAMQPIRESYQSLKQFTADASHELRNPIATIQTNVQMALAYPDAEPQVQQRQWRVVERLTQRLGNLVNDLLFLARADSGTVQLQRQAVPLDALLIEAIEEQRANAEQKGILLSLRIAEPTSTSNADWEQAYTLSGDWQQLARLFTNLIGNAIAYTPSFQEGHGEKPAVEIELRQLKKDRHKQLQVIVKDTGMGIPAADLPHIFDRFYRVDAARSREGEVAAGSGLGLAIAQAIAENHRGAIAVESTLAQGTTFTVTLPVAHAELKAVNH